MMHAISNCRMSRLIGLLIVTVALGFAYTGNVHAQDILNCTGVGGVEDLDGNCTLSSVYVCGDETIVNISGDFIITGTGGIMCGEVVGQAGFDLTINVPGDMTVDGEINSGGGAGAAGTTGLPGEPGFDGGIISVNVEGSMVVNDALDAHGGPGGPGGPGEEGGDGATGATGGSGGDILVDVGGSFLLSSSGLLEADGGPGGSGGAGSTSAGDGGPGATGGMGGTVDVFSCLTTIEGDISSVGGAGGSGGAGGIGGAGGDNGSGGDGGDVTVSSGKDLTLASTASVVAVGANEGSVGVGTPNGSDVGAGGDGGTITTNHCPDFALVDNGAFLAVVGGLVGGSAGSISNLADAPCCPCQVQITKAVAVDDDCDGSADGPFLDSVIQDEGECVVYEICVTNSATNGVDIPQDLLDVQVNDAHLDISLASFGDLEPGDTVCQLVPSEIPAGECTSDPDSCVCEEVQGMNTAVVANAECAATGEDACGEDGSDCDDMAEVACVGCSVDIQKTVAIDDDCDGVADGPFLDSVIQDEGACVIYQICVANTGDQDLDASGVTVNDATLGVVDLDFGTIASGDPAVCQLIPVDAPATECTTDPDSCVCEEVEGTNTAEVTAAVCTDTQANACDFPESNCDDTADVTCVNCSVDIDKTVALDDNCDGVADGPFVDSVTQDEGECVIYQICVTNTGEVNLNTSGVEVSDATLGVVDLNFGTLIPDETQCQEIPVDAPASECTSDPDSCVCEEVEGTNTAMVTSAICEGTDANACDFAASDCDDTAEVDCLTCSVEIDKTVALDDDCDGIADGPFVDSVTQENGECVIYQICVLNTGEQDLDASGVTVNDATLGVVDLDFGTIAAGDPAACQFIPVDAPASECTTDPDSCVCEEVEGVNTAEITAAVCSETEENACDFAASDCDDTAEVECAGEGCLTRTPGYWGTHPEITALFLPVTSCGLVVDMASEAVQDMCWGSADFKDNDTSAQHLQLIRQCTAARLNLAATAFFGGDCDSAFPLNGSITDRIDYCCEDLCASGPTKQEISMSGCISDLDEFNNYMNQLDPLDNTDLCPNELLGTEPPCSADSEMCREASGDGVINPR